MPIEIERRFLVEKLPVTELQNVVLEEIEQGYLIQEPDRKLRIRGKGMLFVLAEKRGAGLSRDEHEIVINEQIFDGLWPITGGMRLEGDRQYKYAQLAKTGKPGNG